MDGFLGGFVLAVVIGGICATPALVYSKRANQRRTMRNIVLTVVALGIACGFLRITGNDYTARCEAGDRYDIADCNAYGDVGTQFLLIIVTCTTLLFMGWSTRSRLIRKHGRVRPRSPRA